MKLSGALNLSHYTCVTLINKVMSSISQFLVLACDIYLEGAIEFIKFYVFQNCFDRF